MTQQIHGTEHAKLKYSEEAFAEMYEALKTVREQVANFLYPKVKLLSSKELIVLMDKALAFGFGKEK